MRIITSIDEAQKLYDALVANGYREYKLIMTMSQYYGLRRKLENMGITKKRSPILHSWHFMQKQRSKFQ